MNANSAQRLQYLHTRTPADDRHGRSTSSAPHAFEAIIGGPAFEMSSDDSGKAPELPSAKSDPGNPGSDAQSDAISLPSSPSSLPIEPATSPLPDAKRFILAGKAIFTLVGLSGRYTYKVSKREDSTGQYAGKVAYFVSLLTGPENTTDYTYLGLLDDRTGQVRLTKASKLTDDSTPIKALRWAMARIWAGRSIEPATIMHAGRCGRCGRLLTVPESIATGFGPECAGRL